MAGKDIKDLFVVHEKLPTRRDNCLSRASDEMTYEEAVEIAISKVNVHGRTFVVMGVISEFSPKDLPVNRIDHFKVK